MSPFFSYFFFQSAIPLKWKPLNSQNLMKSKCSHSSAICLLRMIMCINHLTQYLCLLSTSLMELFLSLRYLTKINRIILANIDNQFHCGNEDDVHQPKSSSWHSKWPMRSWLPVVGCSMQNEGCSNVFWPHFHFSVLSSENWTDACWWLPFWFISYEMKWNASFDTFVESPEQIRYVVVMHLFKVLTREG